MSTFGRIGEKYIININIRGHVNKGDVCVMESNLIDDVGDLKMSNIKTNIEFYAKPNQLVLYDETNRWKFSVPVMEEIDFKLMLSDMTKKNPLLLVTANEQNIVVIHHSLVEKSEILDIELPEYENSLSYNTLTINNSFSEWVDWAKKVKSAKWNKKSSKKITVNVNSPTI